MVAETETPAFSLPAELSADLGWKPLPEGNYEPYRSGSIFAVASEPAKWPAARAQASAWFSTAPAFEQNPAEHLLRKLAQIETLALGAANRETAEALRAERKTLRERGQQLRAIRSKDGADWQARNAADQLQQLDKTLGEWLADSPAERVQAFREELETYRPADRAKIAARYGGEERLAELIKLAHEHARLKSAYEAAQRDTQTPEPARKLALKKAAGELGYFYGFNGTDHDLRNALQDPDLASEVGGEARPDYRSLSVPDLVTWIGENDATGLLAEAYALPVEVRVESDNRTGALARRLLLAGKIAPARVPWSLLAWQGQSVGADGAAEIVALFDVLKKQFPDMAEKSADNSDWSRKRSLGVVACALAVSGRMDEATAILGKTEADDIGLPYHARLTEGAAGAIWDLIVRTPGRAQDEGGWSTLTELVGPAKRGAELTAFAARQAADAPKDGEAAKIWRTRHGWALVGEDKIDEGLEILTAGLDVRPSADEPKWAAEWSKSAARVLLLAKALPRPELARAWGEKLAVDFKIPSGPVWANSGLFDAFAAQRLAAGDFALIEEILKARLAAPKVSENDGRRGRRNSGSGEGRVDRAETTRQLADVLGRQGRHAEVVALLAESPDWGATDLAQQLGRSGGGVWRTLPLVAAESLQAVGRGDEAVAILEAELIANSGHDPVYTLYTRIRGQQAVPFLEKLWVGDHYEERPLIWLASLQLADGKVDAAEATVKRAIATDPSDGEQPKNDRMRAYAVLREVALKRGDTAQAEFLAGVLAAIRRSENADDLAEAGLIARAIKEYELALESFSDAYCIQSRLARRLAQENRLAEAAEHYKRAFELMPDSFGRVESHCFGCEQAFAGPDAQSIAEKVFTDLAAKPGVKPQVYYLMGYLRKEQERWEEAADYFNKAVAADPDYLNAWVKLADVLPNTLRPRAERDRVAFRLLALDTAGRHGGSETGRVRDLPALWAAYAASDSTVLSAPEKVFPLGNKAGKARRGDPDMNDYSDENRDPRTPAERLARHDVLQAITQTMDALCQWRTSPR